MQYGKRCAVGVVADVTHLSTLKLELRMKAGELDDAFKSVLIDHPFGDLKKIIKVQKVVEQRGVDQQRGL